MNEKMRAGMVGFLEQIARDERVSQKPPTCVIFNTVTIERTSFARYPFIYGIFCSHLKRYEHNDVMATGHAMTS